MSEQAIDTVQVAAIAPSPPAVELALQQSLSSAVQQVQDEYGNGSALYLGTTMVGVGTSAPTHRLSVVGNPGWESLATLHSQGDEASIEFLNDNDGRRWHLGSGSSPGRNSFFLYNPDDGFVFTILNKTLTVNGTIVANGLVINGSTTVQGILPANQAPSGSNLETLQVDINTGKLYYS